MSRFFYVFVAAVFLAGVLFSLIFPAFWAVVIALAALAAAVIIMNKNRGCRR